MDLSVYFLHSVFQFVSGVCEFGPHLTELVIHCSLFLSAGLLLEFICSSLKRTNCVFAFLSKNLPYSRHVDVHWLVGDRRMFFGDLVCLSEAQRLFLEYST